MRISVLKAPALPLAFLLCIASPSEASAEHRSPEQLLNLLISSNTSHEQWQEALQSFEKLPADLAIRTLYPEIARRAPHNPASPIYNCGPNPEQESRRGWGHYCTVNWLWCHVLFCDKSSPQVGRTLLDLWQHPLSAYGQSTLLSALDGPAWIPEAEAPISALFANEQADPQLRAQAAACLLHRFGMKYHRQVVAFAQVATKSERDLLFRELAQPPHASLSGADSAVAKLGFSLLLEEETARETRVAQRLGGNSYYGEFLFANLLGEYLSQPFTPDFKLPKYRQSETELGRELWYRETAENALHWWLLNKDLYAN
jgi:hypothetical protein